MVTDDSMIHTWNCHRLYHQSFLILIPLMRLA